MGAIEMLLQSNNQFSDVFGPIRMQDGSKVLIGVLAAAAALWAYNTACKKHRSSNPELKVKHCRAAYGISQGRESVAILAELTDVVECINVLIKQDQAVVSRVQLPIEIQRQRTNTCHRLW